MFAYFVLAMESYHFYIDVHWWRAKSAVSGGGKTVKKLSIQCLPFNYAKRADGVLCRHHCSRIFRGIDLAEYCAFRVNNAHFGDLCY